MSMIRDGAIEDSWSLNCEPPSLCSETPRMSPFCNGHAIGPLSVISRPQKKELRRTLHRDMRIVGELIARLDMRILQITQGGCQSQLPGIHMNPTQGGAVMGQNTNTALKQSMSAGQGSNLVLPSEAFSFSQVSTERSARETGRISAAVMRSYCGVESQHPSKGGGKKRLTSSMASNCSRESKRLCMDRAQSQLLAEAMKQCVNALRSLMTNKHGWIFNMPVDAVKLRLPDYHMIIKRPMDLGTIKGKITRKEYHSPYEFADDIRLTFNNAMTYNPPIHEVHIIAYRLLAIFEEKWRVIEAKYNKGWRALEDEVEIPYQPPMASPPPFKNQSFSGFSGQLPQARLKPNKAKKPTASVRKVEAKPKARPTDGPAVAMTFEEKKQLTADLEQLPLEELEPVVRLMRERNPSICQIDGEIEVDLEAFDQSTLWELRLMVPNFMKTRGEKQKTTPESHTGCTNQSLVDANGEQSCKGDMVDEDVDIGNDLPMPVFPHVVIDKDADNAISFSSSDSSSTDSKSSTDSDSNSDSDNDEE